MEPQEIAALTADLQKFKEIAVQDRQTKALYALERLQIKIDRQSWR